MDEKKDSKPEKKVNLYLRFTSVAIQMGAIIGGFTWLGTFLDDKQKNKTPIWTIVLSLFGVFASMYLIFKELKNINKE
jgi:ATP synthase protein I